MKTLVILGSCGTSRETFWVAREADSEIVAVFVDDVRDVDEVSVAGLSVPVVRNWDFAGIRRDLGAGDRHTFREFVVGMGDPKIKKFMVAKALEHGLRPAPTLISPRAQVRNDCTIGVGGVIQQDSVLTTNVKVADFVTIHMARAGHDVVMDDYVTCAPGSNTSGHVHLMEGVYLGVATVVKPRVTIAPWVVTGVQAAVVKNITEPGITVMGVPARKAEKGDFSGEGR